MPNTSQDDTLTRVRDNQRRCRARRRAYIQELEAKLQDCETIGIEPDVKTYRSTVEKLKDENRRLRELLDQVGVSGRDVRAYLGEDVIDGANELVISHENESIALSGYETTHLLPDDEKTSAPPNFNDFLSTPFSNLSDDFLQFDPPQSVPLPDLSSTLPTIDGVDSTNQDLHPPIPSTAQLSESTEISNDWSLPPFCFVPGDLESVESPQKECDTTLCTVAYDMIRQQNNRGVDMIEIGIRLWNGFVKGEKDDEGCKVKNDLLFSVLEYIKG
ncbi:uncharacterized protein PAC_08357 [Phialocephala subalpina]|uniref:BZIP domain-containing protein n=1 Tax=Phialocephala subalpina TaxID=576137 RepID=A0A1L7X0C4_9HELO|nr:uncharacterized protein PAC_08357 [Phialocephala subalpina]